MELCAIEVCVGCPAQSTALLYFNFCDIANVLQIFRINTIWCIRLLIKPESKKRFLIHPRALFLLLDESDVL